MMDELVFREVDNGFQLELPGDEFTGGNFIIEVEDLQHMFPILTLLQAGMTITIVRTTQ